MLKLASSLMAASALHIAVLAGTGWFHGGEGPQRGAHAAQADTHAGTWQWRLVAAKDVSTSVTRAAPATSTQAKAEGQATSTEDLAPSAATQAKDEYLPRSKLSQPPRALGMIDIPFPPGVPTPGRYKAVLALYIDEQGVVRRVKVDDAALPAAYESAARVSFQTASFQPGELNGHPVKSLIHVEVVFDDSPQPSGMSTSTLGQTVAQR